MSAIVWQDPPNVHGSQTEKFSVIAELKKQPGTWALVATDASYSFATALKRAGCEATTRNQKNGKADIYARWPEQSEATS